MFNLNPNIPNPKDTQWRIELDQFALTYEKELSALAWILTQEWQDKTETLGIDLKPKPHFVACSRIAIEELNEKVNGNLQEILGILDGYNPLEEIVIIGIGEGQIKLINFKPKIQPQICFNEVNLELNQLIEKLENIMGERFTSF